MKKLATITTIAAFAMAPAAFAGSGPAFADIDTNADGFLSVSEIQAVAPEVTEEEVAAYDADADSMLSEVEFEAWKMDQKKDSDTETETESDY